MATARPNNGGRRPGAGRKLGAATKKTREVADRLAAEDGASALEVMTRTMRAIWTKAVDAAGQVVSVEQAKEACAIAEKVAPYMHPRLASVEQFVDAKVRQFAVSGEPLSEDEWDRTYGPLATTAGTSESAH